MRNQLLKKLLLLTLIILILSYHSRIRSVISSRLNKIFYILRIKRRPHHIQNVLQYQDDDLTYDQSDAYTLKIPIVQDEESIQEYYNNDNNATEGQESYQYENYDDDSYETTSSNLDIFKGKHIKYVVDNSGVSTNNNDIEKQNSDDNISDDDYYASETKNYLKDDQKHPMLSAVASKFDEHIASGKEVIRKTHQKVVINNSATALKKYQEPGIPIISSNSDARFDDPLKIQQKNSNSNSNTSSSNSKTNFSKIPLTNKQVSDIQIAIRNTFTDKTLSSLSSKNLLNTQTFVHNNNNSSNLPVHHNSPSSEAKNIFFLKTHKTGSSTLQNIILRYGEKNNLQFALPKAPAAHVYNYNVKFDSWMARKTIHQPNILCNHLRYDFRGVNNLLPYNSTLYISIVRDPVSQFKSVFSYYMNDVYAFRNVQSAFPSKKVKENINYLLHEFLKTPYKYIDKSQASHYEHLYKNPMAYDFGIEDAEYKYHFAIRDAIQDKNNEQLENLLDGFKGIDLSKENLLKDENNPNIPVSILTNNFADNYRPLIKKILSSFHFILNMNYFDESLVLLNSLLNWDWRDLAFIKKNSRILNSKDRDNEKELYDDIDFERLARWNYLDFMIYKIVNTTFHHQLKNFGHDRLQTGLNQLRRARHELTSHCIDRQKSDPNKSFKITSNGVQIQKYELKKGMENMLECKNLIVEERKYLYRVLTKQMKEMDERRSERES